MSDAIDLKERVMSLKHLKENTYDGVEVWADDTLIGSSPIGVTLANPYKVEFPWNKNSQGQTIAENIWDRLNGFVYNPFEASGALLDPAAQLGDIVKIRGERSIIGRKEPLMNSLYASDIAAPQETEEDTEYEVKSIQQRVRAAIQTVSRAYASLQVNVNDIIAEVTDGQGNYTVLTMDAQGVVVKGNSGQVSIKGSQIEAGSLVLTDNLSFTTVSSTASGAAADIGSLVDGVLMGGTFINGRAIYSPTIYANEFSVKPRQEGGQWLSSGSYSIYGMYGNTEYHFLRMRYTDYGSQPTIFFESPGGAYCRFDFDVAYYQGVNHYMSATNYYINSQTLSLNTYLYGTSLPSTGTTGQIFFLI